jgi:aspartyl-tRNA(Asn)/glutamyl-tRNA(Gln) amidotransferase subunit A
MNMQLIPAEDETIAGALASFRSQRRTCVSVVEACVRTIDALENQVLAWVSVDRAGALARAAELDADIAAGRWRGALHGIPVGIKDLIDVAGCPTGAGSKSLTKQLVDHDAPLVTRLRHAGAIILGKTVTTQFACFDPPLTRNPWNLDRTPGGSSSGSAAAVASGMCLAAIGTQTGGSITRPASFCGVAGCKPTFGRVPIDGVFPVAKSLDHPGPIARTVGDLALLTAVLTGSKPFPVAPGGPPRLAVLHGLFEERVEPEMREAFDATIQRLSAAGARVSDARLPASFTDVLPMHRRIMLHELAELHGERFTMHPEEYLPGIRSLIEEARRLPVDAYSQALGHQASLRAEMSTAFEGVDVLVCPATVGPAPDPSTTGDPSFNSPWSYTGLPTVSFPIGLSPDGLPLAIQFVGRHDDEAALFQTALWSEVALRR